ncbi:MAG: AAA family ATPase, partial [Pseudomonadales bacterium]
AEGLFHAIAHELGIEMAEANSHIVLKVIEEELMQLAVLGRKPILIVDEAQSMPAQTLEALRLVTNLETEKLKLLQVVLFGQPELDVILAQNAMRQLVQRITFSYHLKPLDMTEVKAYVGHRLGKAGYCGEPLFDNDAIVLIAKASCGTPRLINVLAHKALMCAYGKREKLVGRNFVYAAIDDTEGMTRPGWSFWPRRTARVA